MNYIESFANFFYVISTILASKNSIHTWWTGIISCLLFMILFFTVKLYADVTLQLFFIGTCIYGWFVWNRGGKNKTSLPISRIKFYPFICLTLLSVTLSIGYGVLLQKLTDASFPFWDSFILTLSVLSQFLITERKIENWLVWIIVDAISIPLYLKKDLCLTSLLYFFLLIIGIFGFFSWKKNLTQV